VIDTWMPDGDGVLALPSGRLVRNGVPADHAVEYVRHYHPDAVETERQRQFVAEFG